MGILNGSVVCSGLETLNVRDSTPCLLLKVKYDVNWLMFPKIKVTDSGVW